MRLLSSTILFLSFLWLTTGCQQEEVAPNFISTDPQTLAQKWEWDSYSGGVGGLPETPVTNHSELRQYTADGTLIRYENGQEVARTTYTRGMAVSQTCQQQRDMITSAGDMPFIILKLTPDELVVQEDVYDGLKRTYHPAQRSN